MEYDRVLLTTDGSDEAEQAVDDAVSIAGKYDSEIHILYVSDIRAGMTDPSIEQLVENLEERGQEAVSSIEEKIPEVLDVTTEVRPGIPHKEILSYVEEENINLICMSSHGRSGIDRMLIGSVTEKVTRRSPVPVLTVPMQQDS